MKKAILILHIIFAVVIIISVLLCFSEAGIAWLSFMVPVAVVIAGADLACQLIAYRKDKSKRAVYQLVVTAIVLLVLILAMVQFFVFVSF